MRSSVTGLYLFFFYVAPCMPEPEVAAWGQWQKCTETADCAEGVMYRKREVLSEANNVLQRQCDTPEPVTGDMTLYNCANTGTFPSSHGTLTVRANAPWPASQFCSAISSTRIPDHTRYSVSVQVNNVSLSGHPGIALNVIDWMNFDFVYFQVQTGCFIHGYVTGGTAHFKNDPHPIACIDKPNGWLFELKGEVMGDRVTIYADGDLVYNDGLTRNGRGAGVLACNGYYNTFIYRNFVIENLN